MSIKNLMKVKSEQLSSNVFTSIMRANSGLLLNLVISHVKVS